MLDNSLALVAQKGGVAKTTTVANLASIFGARGERTLVVDLDPQFDLTRSFGCAPSEAAGTSADIFRAFMAEVDFDLADIIVREVAPGVDLIAGEEETSRAESQLAAFAGREHALRRAIAQVADDYEHILFDCPRSLGLITENAMLAAGELLVPVSMRDPWSFQSAAVVVSKAARLSKALDAPVSVKSFLRTMVEKYSLPPTERTKSYRAVNEALPSLALPIAATEIPYRADFANSAVLGEPLVIAYPKTDAAQAYRSLADELAPAKKKAVA